MRRASLIAVHAWPPPRTVSSRAGSAAPDLAAIEAEAARRLAGLLDNWRKTTPTSRSARLSCATARADAGRLVRLRRSGGHRLGPARLGMGSVTVQALAAASGAGLSRSCVQQVDRYFRVGLKYCLLAIDDDRLTTAFWTRQHECRGDVIRGHRHGVAVPFELEVHGVPVGRKPWLEGHLAVPDAESAESADDHLPGPPADAMWMPSWMLPWLSARSTNAARRKHRRHGGGRRPRYP